MQLQGGGVLGGRHGAGQLQQLHVSGEAACRVSPLPRVPQEPRDGGSCMVMDCTEDLCLVDAELMERVTR